MTNEEFDRRMDRLTERQKATDERIDKLAETVQDLERVMRQGFAVLTELHADTQRENSQAFQKLANSMSALADHVADHEARLNKLEGK